MILYVFFLSIFSINSATELPSEIKVHYHVGYDWSGEFEGRTIKGGKILNQFMVFELSKSGRNYKSERVETENILSEWTENGFGENLINNCCEQSIIRKSFPASKFQKVINSIFHEDKLIVKELIVNDDLIDKIYLVEELTLDNFSISEKELVKLYLGKTKSNKTIDNQEIVDIFLHLVMVENRYPTINSSVTEWLKIEFVYNGSNFMLSPVELGKNCIGWRITKDNFPYYYSVISPKLNEFVASIINKKIEAKSQLKEFKKKKYIEAYFD